MKKITFSPAAKSATYSMQDFRNLVVIFLNKNGMKLEAADEFVKVSSNNYRINFDINCSKNDYTRAFALLQLIFSSENAPCYFRYALNLIVTSPSDAGISLHIAAFHSVNEAYNWLKDRMIVTIE
jgi:hypothetical protein